MSTGPFLNHVEMAYRPGTKDIARAFFETLGTHVIETGAWLTIYVDPDKLDNWADNIMYASEAIPAQKAFEDELERVIASDEKLSAAIENYKKVRTQHPQFTFHFGIALPTHDAWVERVAIVQEAAKSHPLLAGHIEVFPFEPGVEFAISTQSQCFVRTDFLVAEGYSFGLEIELQWTPVDENGKSNAGITGYFPSEEELS